MKKKLSFNNTYQSGAVTYLVFKEKGKFVAVCLEFDLEVEAKTVKEARERIEDLAQGWLDNVVKNKLSEELLNKPAPKKYWRLLEKAKKSIAKRSQLSARVIPHQNIPIYNFSHLFYNPQFSLTNFSHN